MHVRARAAAVDRTGVEMEAPVEASLAALTLYEMLKASSTTIQQVALVEKRDGRGGAYVRAL